MANVERVLIVGGGIAGLTLAAALHRLGFRTELVERNPTWHAVGAGFLIQGNGMRMLHKLHLGAAAEQAGAIVRRWDFCDDQGEVLCETDLEAMWGDAGPCVGIARTKLQQVLLSGVAGVRCRLGTSITSLAQESQRVSVAFSDGLAGEYDLVVGADGRRSTVRDRAGLGRAPTAFSIRYSADKRNRVSTVPLICGIRYSVWRASPSRRSGARNGERDQLAGRRVVMAPAGALTLSAASLRWRRH